VSAELVYLLAGGALFLAVVLPAALQRLALSAPLVLLVAGALIGLLPQFTEDNASPQQHLGFTLHLTEICVLVALMGVGLALDRPLDLRARASWRGWGATWRLLGIGMPLTIAGVAFLGWWAVGLAPAGAVLLGAALAPTDPVLASDIQVEGPTALTDAEQAAEIDEEDEVRFALTSEAGLNDGLAFPFVSLAVLLVTAGGFADIGLRWVGWDLLGRTLIGVVVGSVLGWLLARVAFRAPMPSLRMAETGEPLLAVAAVLLSNGVAGVLGGYGFLAVFACALTMRAGERRHEYHVHMHQVVERLERLLTLAVLLLLGVAMTNGMLKALTWPAVLVAVLLVFVVRPVAGWVALSIGSATDRVGARHLNHHERWVTAFFGVRGVGSLFYLAYATHEAEFADVGLLWSTVGFTIALSVLVHGVAATPVIRWLESRREGAAEGEGAAPA
jgi:NhaP-type Na+/H+ or K+/H+ antiporter